MSATGTRAGPAPASPEDPVLAVGTAFKAAIAAMRRMRGRENRHPDELGEAQYWLLFWLREQSPRPASELGQAAGLSPASTTEMLEALEHAGLVVRERSETDRRVVLNSLTRRGRELVEQRRARYEPRLRAALSEFSPEELGVAARVLGRLEEMFDARAGEAEAVRPS